MDIDIRRAAPADVPGLVRASSPPAPSRQAISLLSPATCGSTFAAPAQTNATASRTAQGLRLADRPRRDRQSRSVTFDDPRHNARTAQCAAARPESGVGAAVQIW